YEAHANTSGNYAHANTSGNEAHANTSGYNSISCSLGIHSKSKAVKGWIVIVDWIFDNDFKEWKINNIHSSKVGWQINGVTIEPDTWYWFEEGELKLIKD
ncbi:MAG TPA: hypothetical protein PK210_05205, partial [Bacteroidia bacterium]|nr:hypothetical protein [Bacteroidia bacterium]